MLILHLLILRFPRTKRRIKPLPYRRDHLTKPEPIETIKRKIGCKIRHREPKRDTLLACEAPHFAVFVVYDGRVCGFVVVDGCVWAVDVAAVHVFEDDDGLIRSPYQSAAEECEEETDAVVELDIGTRHVEFVAEPVDVEEWRRQLIEDEYRAVEVEKRALV